jgi:hypothetical protein
MEQCGIRPHLWLQVNGVGFIKPIAPYVLTHEGKNWFMKIILNLKTPSHYVYSLKKRVQKDGGLRGMKSNDFRVMM